MEGLGWGSAGVKEEAEGEGEGEVNGDAGWHHWQQGRQVLLQAWMAKCGFGKSQD